MNAGQNFTLYSLAELLLVVARVPPGGVSVEGGDVGPAVFHHSLLELISLTLPLPAHHPRLLPLRTGSLIQLAGNGCETFLPRLSLAFTTRWAPGLRSGSSFT